MLASENHVIGSGHVARQITIIDSLRDQGFRKFVFLGQFPNRRRATLEKFGAVRAAKEILPSIAELQDTVRHLKVSHQKIVIIRDAYDLPEQVGVMARKLADLYVVLSDWGDSSIKCHILLDPNLNLGGDLVRQSSDRTQIAVPIVKRGFIPNRVVREAPRGRIRHILVTLGHSDPDDYIFKIWKYLEGLPSSIQFTFALGNNYKGRLRVNQFAVRPRRTAVSGWDFSHKSLSQFDVVIGAAGVSSFERQVAGIPQWLVAITPNQYANLAKLSRERGVQIYGLASQLGKGKFSERTQKFLRLELAKTRLTKAKRYEFDGVQLLCTEILRRLNCV